MAKKERYVVNVEIEGIGKLTPQNWSNFLLDLRDMTNDLHNQIANEIHEAVIVPQLPPRELN